MTDPKLASDIIDPKGMMVRYTWIPSSSHEMLRPFKQVYGVVFNREGDVLVINENGKWQLPGGTPEAGEEPELTLVREFMEEADVTLKNIKFIGAQKVEFLKYGNPNKDEGDRFYQYRFIADIDQLLPQTPDPDGGETHPRKFIKFEELKSIVNWGTVGEAMFKTALDTHKQQLT